MRKKLLYSLICITVIVSFYVIGSFKSVLDTNCAFCDPQIVNRQKFYEDDLVIALYTHKPIVPSHFLIIPKRHAERLDALSDEEISRIHQVITKVNQASEQVFQTSSYLILQKNGQEAGQTVPHVHFHLIALPAGDHSPIKFIAKMLLANLRKPIATNKMQNITEKMKISIESENS